MNLPKAVSDLLQAQKTFNSVEFAKAFSANAMVSDEGIIYRGNREIKNWNEKTNSVYKMVLDPINYEESGSTGILTTKVSGTFDGSPIEVKYHFTFSDGIIQSLKITG